MGPPRPGRSTSAGKGVRVRRPERVELLHQQRKRSNSPKQNSGGEPITHSAAYPCSMAGRLNDWVDGLPGLNAGGGGGRCSHVNALEWTNRRLALTFSHRASPYGTSRYMMCPSYHSPLSTLFLPSSHFMAHGSNPDSNRLDVTYGKSPVLHS